MGEEGKFERLASRGCEYILPRVTDTHFTPNVSKYITTNENYYSSWYRKLMRPKQCTSWTMQCTCMLQVLQGQGPPGLSELQKSPGTPVRPLWICIFIYFLGGVRSPQSSRIPRPTEIVESNTYTLLVRSTLHVSLLNCFSSPPSPLFLPIIIIIIIILLLNVIQVKWGFPTIFSPADSPPVAPAIALGPWYI
jgi:hypothetical protein